LAANKRWGRCANENKVSLDKIRWSSQVLRLVVRHNRMLTTEYLL
jgi:hypothetical protein